jgi:hypothetical protein
MTTFIELFNAETEYTVLFTVTCKLTVAWQWHQTSDVPFPIVSRTVLNISYRVPPQEVATEPQQFSDSLNNCLTGPSNDISAVTTQKTPFLSCSANIA